MVTTKDLFIALEFLLTNELFVEDNGWSFDAASMGYEPTVSNKEKNWSSEKREH